MLILLLLLVPYCSHFWQHPNVYIMFLIGPSCDLLEKNPKPDFPFFYWKPWLLTHHENFTPLNPSMYTKAGLAVCAHTFQIAGCSFSLLQQRITLTIISQTQWAAYYMLGRICHLNGVMATNTHLQHLLALSCHPKCWGTVKWKHKSLPQSEWKLFKEMQIKSNFSHHLKLNSPQLWSHINWEAN